MRVAVVSDTHGNNSNLSRVMKVEGDIDLLIHLGDVEASLQEIEKIAKCPVQIVAGNTDFFSCFDREKEFDVLGRNIFITHGHRYAVSKDTDVLKQEAIFRGADIVMYGHTHRPEFTFDDHLIVMNPGSLTRPRQEGGLPSYIMLEMNKTNEISASIRYLNNTNLYPEHFYRQEIQLPSTFL